MIIKSSQKLNEYKEATSISTKILRQLYDFIEIGRTGLQVDKLADSLCQKHQVKSAFKGVKSGKNIYQYTTCISVNDTIVHGIPSSRKFCAGDVIKVDFGIIYKGLYTDHCFTVGLKELTKQDKNLITTAHKAILKATRQAIVGKTTGDLGFIMEKIANKSGFNTIKDFVGHGIGYSLHEPPQLAAFGDQHSGVTLQEGMLLCVEAQLVPGSNEIRYSSDGWTVKTKDGGKSAMFEFMVVVRKKQPLILTPTMDWPIVK